MNSRKTENLKPNFNNSIKAGFNAIFGSNSSFVVIEHLSNSANFTVGEKNKILVDCVEIGRSPKCAISFSEAEKTVSRLHAVIGKEEGNWVLYNKSDTNPTLLNNRPVMEKWFLKNNDIIQFSIEGPKVRFIIPEDNKVNNINLTQRLNLFKEQALRPYRTGLRVIFSLIFLVVAAGTVAFYIGHTSLTEHERLLTELGIDLSDLGEAFAEAQELTEEQIAEIRERAAENEEKIIQVVGNINRQRREIQNVQSRMENVDEAMRDVQNKLSDDYFSDVVNLYKDVYHLIIITTELRSADGTSAPLQNFGQCTGFLLEDGRLVTARHCIESWAFSDNDINMAMSSGNYELRGMVIASNSDGNIIEIPFENFVIPDKSKDVLIECRQSFACIYPWRSYDIAYAQTDMNGNLRANPSLSTSLSVGNTLVVLGFPTGVGGAFDSNEINPVFSQTTVARNGLERTQSKFPFISVTNRNFSEGNSGGPVLYKKGENEYEVIGVISAGLGGPGGAVGVICPIAPIY